MGVQPNVFLKPMEPAVGRIVQRMEQHQPMQAKGAGAELQMPARPSAP